MAVLKKKLLFPRIDSPLMNASKNSQHLLIVPSDTTQYDRIHYIE